MITPWTIDSIVYISQNFSVLKVNVKAGFVLTCIGDVLTNVLRDKVLFHTIKYLTNEPKFTVTHTKNSLMLLL